MLNAAQVTLPPPALSTLPPPPAGKHGWPWQAESVPEAASSTLPTISVITPSLNQGQFIEQTLRSVLLQGYPKLEYIVIDGGSRDETVGILRKYAPWLAYWVSEADRGQSHAINKGLARATGEIMCWLNSDDFFPPGTLLRVGQLLAKGTGNDALVGHARTVFQDGRAPVDEPGRFENRRRLLAYWKGYQMHQPSIFWRREVFETVGLLDESLHLIMDFDYWARMAEAYSFTNVDAVLSCRNQHAQAKTSDNCAGYFEDLRRYRARYWGTKWSLDYWRLAASLARHVYLRPVLQRLHLR
jgi:glycosyltransferase involved in cell wall biosynthesis